MKKFFLSCAAVSMALVGAHAGTAERFENNGVVTNVPQVDALEFVNRGLFSVSSVLPYDFQNTRRYTNFGTMMASVGYRFDTTLGTGERFAAETFHNALGANVNVGSGFALFGIGASSLSGDSILRISATNVINKGILSAGADGIIQIHGENVDVSRSGFEIAPFGVLTEFCTPGGTAARSGTNFTPDIGIADVYWGLDSNVVIGVGGNLGLQLIPETNLVSINAPGHPVVQRFPQAFPNCYFTNRTAFGLREAASWVYTNQLTPSNVIIQAVFVANADPAVQKDVRFFPSSIVTNPFQTLVVELKSTQTNVVTRETITNAVFLIDTLSAETNWFVLTNLLSDTPCPSGIPGPYTLTRGLPCEFQLGGMSNAVITEDLFYRDGFSNTFVTNFSLGYFAAVTNVLPRLPVIPQATYSNLAGRVEIDADVLDMNRLRVRAEGSVQIRTRHLIGSDNSAIDAQNLTLDLASTNGLLTLQSVVKPRVERMAGAVRAWSGWWTNQTGTLSTNVEPDPMDPSLMVTNVVTNVVDIGYHVLIVDGQLTTTQPVRVQEFIAQSTNLVINDPMLLVRTLQIDSENLTVNADIELGNLINGWGAGVAPNLRRFTNNALIDIPNVARIGADLDEPLLQFINSGEIQANNIELAALEFQNIDGSMAANVGGIDFTNETAVLNGGEFAAIGDLRFFANSLEMQNIRAETLSSLVLSVTNNLRDAGPGLENEITVRRGVNMWIKPAAGDLLGTTLISIAPDFSLVPHRWAGQDRGPTAAGFSDNAALGRLVLEGGFDTIHRFEGSTRNNAIYVEFLELAGSILDDVSGHLEIGQNMIVYFADSNVTPEALDGLFADPAAPAGRLRWVPDYAGANSSVALNRKDTGELVLMNRGVRSSVTIDSDNDGLPNGLDEHPLDADGQPMVISSVAFDSPPPTISFSWEAAPNSEYRIEYTSDLGGEWKPLRNVSNEANEVRTATVHEEAAAGEQRFYRITRVK